MVTQFSRRGSDTTEKLKPSYEQLLTEVKSLWEMRSPRFDVSYITLWEDVGERAATFSGPSFTSCLAGWYSYDVQRQQLWYALLGKRRTMQPTTADEIIDLSYADNLSRSAIERALLRLHEVEFEPETALELNVAKLFKEITDVQSIYTDEYLNRKRFLILTSNEKYDDALMDRLLSVEQELHVSYTEVPASFVYIPKLLESVDEIVRRDSKLIYERGSDVRSIGSFVASGAERETSQATA